MSSRCRTRLFAIGLLAAAALPAQGRELRVCAEPDNLPFSDRAGEGFENRIATVLAEAIGAQAVTVPTVQRGRRFLRETLGTGRCDALMGLPLGTAEVALTRPYYRTGWMFVTRAVDAAPPNSFDDPRLHGRTIGVPVVGKGGDTAPLIALGRHGLVERLRRYPVGGDVAEGNPERLLADVAAGGIDVALVWGPVAGYFAARQAVPLALAPTPADDDGVPLAVAFAVATKPGSALRDELDAALGREMPRVRAILAEYRVPLRPE